MTDQQHAGPRTGTFRAWVDALGYVRQNGWLGGVAAAIARRAGVDPLIVRGAFVIAALTWFPALWIYAFAWAALPDADGKSPFSRGRSVLGVLITFVLAMIVTLGKLVLIFSIGAVVGRGYGASGMIIPSLFWFAFVLLVVAGLFWLARRGTTPHAVPSSRTQREEGIRCDDMTPARPNIAPPSDLEAPPSPDRTGDMEAWRAQYAEWRERHNAWRVQQGEDPAVVERELRRQQQADFRAESARIRAERRAANPRTSLAFIGIALGAALLAGGAAGAAVIGGHELETAITVGTFAGAATLALAMVVAGILRRRSGFLACVTVIALLVGGSGVGRAALDDFVMPGATRYPGPAPLTITQPFGTLHLDVGPWDGGVGVTTVTKGSGDVYVIVHADVDVDIRVSLDDGDVVVNEYGVDDAKSRALQERPDGLYYWQVDAENEDATRTIDIAQSSGEVYIEVLKWEKS